MQAERHEAHAPLPHQGLATDDQWVMAYNSTLIPIA